MAGRFDASPNTELIPLGGCHPLLVAELADVLGPTGISNRHCVMLLPNRARSEPRRFARKSRAVRRLALSKATGATHHNRCCRDIVTWVNGKRPAPLHPTLSSCLGDG